MVLFFKVQENGIKNLIQCRLINLLACLWEERLIAPHNTTMRIQANGTAGVMRAGAQHPDIKANKEINIPRHIADNIRDSSKFTKAPHDYIHRAIRIAVYDFLCCPDG